MGHVILFPGASLEPDELNSSLNFCWLLEKQPAFYTKSMNLKGSVELKDTLGFTAHKNSSKLY